MHISFFVTTSGQLPFLGDAPEDRNTTLHPGSPASPTWAELYSVGKQLVGSEIKY